MPSHCAPGKARKEDWGLRRRSAACRLAMIFLEGRVFKMEAIGAILLFLIVFAALNRMEFGRFD